MQGLVLVGEFVAPSLEKTLGKWRQFIHTVLLAVGLISPAARQVKPAEITWHSIIGDNKTV